MPKQKVKFSHRWLWWRNQFWSVGMLSYGSLDSISHLCKVQGPAVAMVPTKVPLIYCSQWCITKLRSIIPRPFERHCQELHFKMYSHLQVPIFSEISAKNDFYHNAAGQRAAILVSPLVCLHSTTLRMNGSHVITTAAHGTNTHSSRARTDQGGTRRRRPPRCGAADISVRQERLAVIINS